MEPEGLNEISLPEDDKPTLLKAVELIIAKPQSIMKEVKSFKERYSKEYGGKLSEEEINEIIIDKIISNYSYYAAFSGGITALPGIVPGLGTALATFGGTTVDIALSIKYQIEMTMAIAVVYGVDLTDEEKSRHCMLIACLGSVNYAAQSAGKSVGSKALVKMSQKYLVRGTLIGIKEAFKKVGITFTRKSLEKSVPFGVGVVVGFGANKGLSWYVGNQVRKYYKLTYSDRDIGI